MTVLVRRKKKKKKKYHMRNKGFTDTTRQRSFFKFRFSCFLQRNVRSRVIYTDNSILPEMSALVITGISDSCAIAWSSPKVLGTP